MSTWPKSLEIIANALQSLVAAGAVLAFLIGQGGWGLAAGAVAITLGIALVAKGMVKPTRWQIVVALITLMLGGFAVGGTVGAWTGLASKPSPTPTSSANKSTSPSTSVPHSTSTIPAILAMEFDPQNRVPFCQDYTGTGEIPKGYELWLFDRDAANPNGPYYTDRRSAERTEHGWRAKEINLGVHPDIDLKKQSVGSRIELVAVLLTEVFANYLRSIETFSSNGSRVQGDWKAAIPELDGHSWGKDKMTVIRTADIGGCPSWWAEMRTGLTVGALFSANE